MNYLNIHNNIIERAKAKGLVHSEESKRSMSINRTGTKNHFYGKTHVRLSCIVCKTETTKCGLTRFHKH